MEVGCYGVEAVLVTFGRVKVVVVEVVVVVMVVVMVVAIRRRRRHGSRSLIVDKC